MHLSALAEPTLKTAGKAVDATDRRRLLGEPEFPTQCYSAVEEELRSARAAAASLLPIQIVEGEARFRQATLTMRAAAGALWALSEGHNANKVSIAGAGCIRELCGLLGSSNERAQKHAASALASLSLGRPENQEQVGLALT